MLKCNFLKNSLNKNNVTYLIFQNFRNKLKTRYYSTQTVPDTKVNKELNEKRIDDLYKLIDKYENNILYNSVIEAQKLKLGYCRNKAFEDKLQKKEHKISLQKQGIEPLPISLKYFNDNIDINEQSDIETNTKDPEVHKITHFPYRDVDKITESDIKIENKPEIINPVAHEISMRQSQLDNGENISHWMTDYENFDDNVHELENWQLEYGTPDPKSKVSNVPCGGCGALLHCKDTSIPGYIPSEIYKNHKFHEGQHLTSIICQRCHFLQNYNMALQVRVSPDEYPKILEKINNHEKALIIIMIDLLDFPCSIWPNIINIIGNKKPIVIVGNKVDLLPSDGRGYLENIKKVLSDSVSKYGLSKANIKHVALISAKTGYGIEELITRLHILWEYRGDVFLVGCTNVGKSSLFNALLQSDYCKVQAVDLIQRATTSIWPGTTMNLLKFPILKPSGWRLYVRTMRIKSINMLRSQEEKLRKLQLKKTNNPKYATLIGHIERTFSPEEPVIESRDIFSVQGSENASGKINIGINDKSREYEFSKWCYDTPGVVQPDQLLHFLTTEELMLTLPKQLIRPQTFSIRLGSTIFIAGLARLDFIEGPKSCRFTIFTCEHLPITICETSQAENLYAELLGTELFKVPTGTKDRFENWPKLESTDEIHLKGVDWEKSCADIVLSSAGWISVTCRRNTNCVLKAWTPERRGIYIRDPILPRSVQLRGKKIRHSPAYKRTRFFIQK